MLKHPKPQYDEEEFDYYFGDNAYVITEPNKPINIFGVKDCTVTAILSSNYTDLYLVTDTDINFELPHEVDFKCEENLDQNPCKLIRNYQLVINRNKAKSTTLQFAERYFKHLNTSYIILIKEYNIDFDELNTKNFSFVMDNNIERPDLNSKTPLHIYFAFSKIVFMTEWNMVSLKNPDANGNILDFKYSLQNMKYHFPVISVLNETTNISPILIHPPIQKKSSLTILSPHTDKKKSSIPEKALNSLRLNPTLPENIDVFQSPGELINQASSSESIQYDVDMEDAQQRPTKPLRSSFAQNNKEPTSKNNTNNHPVFSRGSKK